MDRTVDVTTVKTAVSVRVVVKCWVNRSNAGLSEQPAHLSYSDMIILPAAHRLLLIGRLECISSLCDDQCDEHGEHGQVMDGQVQHHSQKGGCRFFYYFLLLFGHWKNSSQTSQKTDGKKSIVLSNVTKIRPMGKKDSLDRSIGRIGFCALTLH